MDPDQALQLLAELRFTSTLSDSELRQLADLADMREFEAGVSIFTEGEPARELMLIVSGRVELCMNVPARGCLPVLTLESGDLLGWSAVLGPAEMTTSAVAIQKTEVIVLSADELRALCEEDHDIGYAIMKRVAHALADRLIATRLQLLDLFSHNADQILEP